MTFRGRVVDGKTGLPYRTTCSSHPIRVCRCIIKRNGDMHVSRGDGLQILSAGNVRKTSVTSKTCENGRPSRSIILVLRSESLAECGRKTVERRNVKYHENSPGFPFATSGFGRFVERQSNVDLIENRKFRRRYTHDGRTNVFHCCFR
jgi:hypothetical protein